MRGLIVPVLHRRRGGHAPGVARRIRDLADRGGRAQLTADDISWGTFSITNDGPFGTHFTVPIINQPTGRHPGHRPGIARRPVVVARLPMASESIAIHSMGVLGLELGPPSGGRRLCRRPSCATCPTWSAAGAGLPSCREDGRAEGPPTGARSPMPRRSRLQREPWPHRSADDYLLLLEHPHVFTLGVAGRPRLTYWWIRHRWGPRWRLPIAAATSPTTALASWWSTRWSRWPTIRAPGRATYTGWSRWCSTPCPDPRGRGSIGRCGAGSRLPIPGSGSGTGRAARPARWRRLGVRTIRGSTAGAARLHGVAVNVDCDLQMFSHIVPCGISQLPVTSLANCR